MKNYAFLDDGKFKVVTLIEESINDFSDRYNLKLSDFIEVSEEDIRSEFFNAYEIKNSKISCNIEKAKKIKMDKLRVIRQEKLKKLDTEMIIALEMDDKVVKKEIAQEKQKLRDLPNDPKFKKISSVEELVAYDPKILNDTSD